MRRSAEENPVVLREAAHTLVITHPGALGVETYEVLAAALPEHIGVSVYAIDRLPDYRHSVLTGADLDVTLADIAAGFAARINGPHTLLGWSFGGVVAYAVAEQTSPDRLILLDSIAPGTGEDLGGVLPDREALDWFALYLGAKRRTPLGFVPADFTDKSLDEGLKLILEEAIERRALFADTSIDGLRKAFETYRGGVLRNKQLHDGFTPRSPQWPVHLVRPKRGLFNDVLELGWDALVGDLTVHACGADHYTMLTEPEPVRVIAGVITDA